jgi:hypothetical protein
MTGLRTCVGLSAWIIQDGNYDNFRVDTHATFGLEFYAKSDLQRVDGPCKQDLTHIVGPDYKASGRVIYIADEWWVTDFGVPAFQEKKPPRNLNVDDFVQGDRCFGIDPFFYFERLASIPGAPALITDWHIDKIEIQTAPFIKQGNMMVRDEALVGWRVITETDAWKDDGGHAEYILTCTMSARTLRNAR